MKVWYHIKSNNIMISWECYAFEVIDESHCSIGYHTKVGVACENKNGITCVFHEDYLKHFEYIGEFE